MNLPQTKTMPSQLVKPRAILFDWDGTLADTIPLIQDAINHILQQLGHPPAPFGSAGLAAAAGSEGIFRMLLGDVAGMAAKAQYETYLNGVYAVDAGNLGPHLALPGSFELLRYLQQRGIVTCTATNKRRYRMQAESDAIGFTPYLTQIVTLDDVINRKPHPEMMLVAAAKLGLEPASDIWMIGDHRVDTESAKQAGITAIHMEHGFGASDTHPPDAVVPDLAAIISLIEAAEAR